MHAVRKPDVLLEPAHAVEQVDRRNPELAETVRFLVERFGEVRVQPHVQFAREPCRLEHQLRRGRERRAWRQRDSHHGAGLRIVIPLHHAF